MKIKCYEITPHPSTEYDSLVIPAGRTWEPVLGNIENVLDGLYLRQDDPDDKDWTKIQVTIKCVWYDENDLYEMGYDRSDLHGPNGVSVAIPDGEADRPSEQSSVVSWGPWRLAADIPESEINRADTQEWACTREGEVIAMRFGTYDGGPIR